MSHPKYKLPIHTKNRIEYSLRTTWTITICLVLGYYYPWTNQAAYFSPVISILSTVMYFGLWQANYYKVFYGSLIGSGFGVVIGYTYQIKFLQVILIFLTLTWVNRIKSWDRLTIVFFSIAFIFTVLLPNITNGQIYGLESFYAIIAMINVPFLITGVTLLFHIMIINVKILKFRNKIFI